MNKSINIEGVLLNEDMIKQLQTWQKDNGSDLNFEIETIDDTVTFLAENETEVNGGKSWSLVQRLLALKSSLNLLKVKSYDKRD
jgi:hypothetical protein